MAPLCRLPRPGALAPQDARFASPRAAAGGGAACVPGRPVAVTVTVTVTVTSQPGPGGLDWTVTCPN